MSLSLISLFGIFSVPFTIVFLVLEIAADWMIFQKAGEPGWKSIIPVYNGYVSYRIVWRTEFFWINLVLSAAANSMMSWYNGGGSALIGVFAFVLSVLAAVFEILYAIKTARAFGKGTGFILGLIFLNPIFRIILGFGSAQYLGADR